jgi:flagellar basal-body rod protein FlgB
MQHLSGRQKVIAQNIANSETAGFKAREVEAPDFSRLLDALEQIRCSADSAHVSSPQNPV